MNKRKLITFIVSFIIGTIILVEVLRRTPLLSILEGFQQKPPLAVELFLFASLSIMLLHALRWHLVIKSAGLSIPFWRTFAYKIVGYGISFLTPAAKVGGEPLRAMILQRHGWSFGKSFSTVATDKIVEMSVYGVLFIFGILTAIVTLALPRSMIIALVILGVILFLLVIWFYYLIVSDTNIILKLFRLLKLHKFKKCKKLEKNIIKNDKLLISFYKHHPRMFVKALLITVAAWVLMFLEYKSALLIVGVGEISFAGLFLIICTMAVAYMIPVPLALGVLEAGQVSTFAILGLRSAAGIALSLVIRARDFAWTILSLPVLLVFSLRSKKKKGIVGGVRQAIKK